MKTLQNQTVRLLLAFFCFLLPLSALPAREQTPRDLEAKGETLRQEGDPVEALVWLEKAKNEWINQGGWLNPDLGNCYYYMGRTYSDLGNYDEALHHHKLSNELIDLLAEKPLDRMADNFHYIGVNYAHLGVYQRAIVYLNKALNLKRELHGDHHPELAPIYRHLGDFFASREKWTEALLHYHYAILNAFSNFHDTDANAVPEPGRHQLLVPASELNGYFLAKIGLLRKRYESGAGDTDLEAALASCESALAWTPADKALFENALDICHLLFEKNQNIYYLEKAFDLMEQSRHATLPSPSGPATLEEVQVALSQSGSGLVEFFSGENALFGFVATSQAFSLVRTPLALPETEWTRQWQNALTSLPQKVAVVPTGALEQLPGILRGRDLYYALSAAQWLEANHQRAQTTDAGREGSALPSYVWWAGGALALVIAFLALKRYRRRQLLRKIGRL